MTTAPQVTALHEHVIDIGLLREPSDEPGLAVQAILSEEFLAVLPAAHPRAAQRVIPVTALADEPFVLLPRSAGPALHDQILDLCRGAGFEPRLGQQAVEWQTVCALVGAGLGASLAPASIRRIRLTGVAYRRIEPNTARTTVAMAWRPDDQSPLVSRFLKTARSQP